MATLVLSTVGTALGGPVGGAIGSLIGQSIDQQFFGPGPRKGPRIGDLAVQTSSYGTAVPRIYGTMRVAGTVIWATDLQEGSTYVGGKGQPEAVIYSYTVSMAVALSSRRAVRIRRIWADGKLLRGEAGDFKVSTKFRFHAGTQDQDLDPLIASIEGPALTPAYRGLAVAVFETLELAEFGNRIPFFTFEVEADDNPPKLGHVLGDITGKLIVSDNERAVEGYAAYGSSQASAVEPLVSCFGLEFAQSGGKLRQVDTAAAGAVRSDELGCSTTAELFSSVERRRSGANGKVSAAAVGYYDPSRDYQAGLARASHGGGEQVLAEIDAPMVLDALAAKEIAHGVLDRASGNHERLVARLAPRWIGLRPGDAITLSGVQGLWAVERCSVERMIAVAELRPASAGMTSVPADSGRALLSPDNVASPSIIALFDLPAIGASGNQPQIHLAAASASPGWKPIAVDFAAAGTAYYATSAPRQTVLGKSLTLLSAGEPFLIDLARSVDVELVDPGDWLTSCDDEALVAGSNLAVLGDELIQFGNAEPLGPSKFRLSRLLRCRRGTDWAAGSHRIGEPFAMLLPGTLKTLELPGFAVGSVISATPKGISDGAAVAVTRGFMGEALRPPSPVHLGIRQSAEGLQIDWVRRSRSGWEWLDGVDAPLGETRELYEVHVQGSAGGLAIETEANSLLIPSSTLVSLGSGAAALAVRQIGDHARSHPVTAEIVLP